MPMLDGIVSELSKIGVIREGIAQCVRRIYNR